VLGRRLEAGLFERVRRGESRQREATLGQLCYGRKCREIEL
jgi:hypothetical protein